MARPTQAQQVRSICSALIMFIGGITAWWAGGGLAAFLTGGGWWHPPTLRLRVDHLLTEGFRLQATHTPPGLPWAILGGLLGAGVLYLVYRVASYAPDPRNKGLAQWKELSSLLSGRAVRRAGKFTRPTLNWWQRRWPRPLTEFGYHLGRIRGSRRQLWASFEIRVRIIARTGWGKTSRLLIPIARTLPHGPALIGSTAADLFEGTVRARQVGPRLPRGWRPWTRAWWAPGRGPDRPVLVVDFSDADHRYAEGFQRVRWNLVRGCRDLATAKRRALALVAGAEDGDRTDKEDGFFRDAAMHCISAWLHAAALAGLDMTSVLRWQQDIHLKEPHEILQRHLGAEPAARLALLKHLDERAERTTSGVERMMANALHPFATRDGREFSVTSDGVDLAQLIESQTTVYLLASSTTAATVAPLLTVFADEWLYTARSVALRYPGQRLPYPAVAVLDELRRLVPIPSLPVVVYEYRKFNVHVVYAVQNGSQEEELYGPQAESLAQNVQCTIVGGYDDSIAETLTAQAGQIPIPSVTSSGRLLEIPEFAESGTWRDVIDAADQQQLREGQSVVRLAGARLFYAYTPSYRENFRLHRRIRREMRQVHAEVVGAQDARAARQAAWDAHTQAVFTGQVSR